MRKLSLLAAMSAVVTLTLAGSSASAPPTAKPAADPAVTARATALFHEGRAAAEAGDNKTACDRFAESEQLQPAPGTQLNLGACEEKQGHLLAAREHFRKAAGSFGPEDRRRAVAANTASALTDRLATLIVHLAPGTAAETHVSIDGAQLDAAVLDHGVELDPGKTKLVVTAAGRQDRAVELDLAEAEKRELTTEPGALLAPEQPISPPPTPVAHDDAQARGLQRTLGFVGVGAGAAGLALGGVFGGLAFHEASVVKSNCDKNVACNATGASAASSGSTDSVVSTVGFIAGAAFAAAGVYLLVRTWGDDHRAKPIAIVVTPLVSPRGEGGVTGTLSF